MQDRRPKNLQSVINENYTVKIGDYISRGWEIFKQNPGLLIGYVVILVVISSVVFGLPLALQRTIGPELAQSISSLINIIVSPPLWAGLFIGCFILHKGQQLQFNNFFSGFQYFAQLVIASLVSAILIIIGFIFCLVPGIYLAIGYSFMIPLVIDRNLNFWDAMEASRKIVTKQWFSIFAFLIVIGLINTAGALVFGVGLLVTIPLTYGAMVAAYDDIIGIQKTRF
ncbi:hypothetical protein IQ249_18435 [Lusitaniella coriacea LEGE 07157]|uniref:DUF975 family protein n=1 Tax=Lusitaniella coriacea LEGE 07157 TaxID=945747 RepID=A0A8J7DYL3_9CYAN|nr:hypothetical protein [Lusitaniella coriacea]MBE9117879.1 hypothetical protein [Lusitaniella coriacea LEGE 07157]